MADYIQSAEYLKYNANNRGTNTGDCVKRAISLAFDKAYVETGQELNRIRKECRSSKWNIHPVFDALINEWGGGKEQDIHNLTSDDYPELTVDEFLNQNPEGVYLLETNNKPSRMKSGHHLTCAIDGKLYDSWDSREEYVVGYWTIEGRSEFVVTDIKDRFKELGSYAVELLEQLAEKYVNKYHLEDSDFETGSVGPIVSGYTIKITGYFTYHNAEFDHRYSFRFKIAFVLNPTMSYDEAKRYIQETAKVRMYDRFYSINKNIKDDLEGLQLAKDSTNKVNEDLWIAPGREQRFYKSLPGWCKPFVAYVNVDEPGQYSDSYKVELRSIPGDPRPASSIWFEGYDSAMVKSMLNRYKETYQRPHEDYDPYEEY